MNLSAITADVAAWMAAQPFDKLPLIAAVRLGEGFAAVHEVEFQLWSRDGLNSLASWAEHVGTTATVRRFARAEFVDARVTTSTSQGYPIAVWTHLETYEWQALEAATGTPITESPVEVTPEMLRRAADGGES